VSLEDGTVRGYDVRFVAQTSASSAPGKDKPVFMIHAHDKAVCTVSYNTTVPHVRGIVYYLGGFPFCKSMSKFKVISYVPTVQMLATGSTDKMVNPTGYMIILV
jgi:hypothetical protein